MNTLKNKIATIMCWFLGHKVGGKWVTFEQGTESPHKERLLELRIDGVWKGHCERCSTKTDSPDPRNIYCRTISWRITALRNLIYFGFKKRYCWRHH